MLANIAKLNVIMNGRVVSVFFYSHTITLKLDEKYSQRRAF